MRPCNYLLNTALFDCTAVNPVRVNADALSTKERNYSTEILSRASPTPQKHLNNFKNSPPKNHTPLKLQKLHHNINHLQENQQTKQKPIRIKIKRPGSLGQVSITQYRPDSHSIPAVTLAFGIATRPITVQNAAVSAPSWVRSQTDNILVGDVAGNKHSARARPAKRFAHPVIASRQADLTRFAHAR